MHAHCARTQCTNSVHGSARRLVFSQTPRASAGPGGYGRSKPCNVLTSLSLVMCSSRARALRLGLRGGSCWATCGRRRVEGGCKRATEGPTGNTSPLSCRLTGSCECLLLCFFCFVRVFGIEVRGDGPRTSIPNTRGPRTSIPNATHEGLRFACVFAPSAFSATETYLTSRSPFSSAVPRNAYASLNVETPTQRPRLPQH
jgi:hypothetical protein